MRRQSIRAKLLIFLIVVVLTPALPGSYIFYQYESTLAGAEQVRQQSAQTLALVHQVIESFQQQNIAWTNFLLRGHKPELYNAYLSGVYAMERQTDSLANSLAARLEGEPAYQGNMRDVITRLRNMREHYREALDIYNQSDEPHFATDHYLSPFIDDINNHLRATVAEIEQIEKQKLDVLNSRIDHQKELFLLSILISLLVIVGLFLWLFDLNIGKPIAAAIRTAEQISQGQITTRIREDAPHEFAAFSNAFNHMIDNLELANRQLEQKIDELLDEVNQRKMAERKIRAQRQALRESGKLIEIARQEALSASQAKSEFLSRMSHELRTPLNAILGFAQVLDLESLTSNQKDSVREIITAGRHLLNLINEILDLSKIESGILNISLEVIDVSTLVNETLSLVKPLADERRITIEPDRPSFAGHQLEGDPTRCKEILLNLLSNAIKYGHANGRVWLYARAESNLLTLSVCDNGPGIAPEFHAKMFQAFNRLAASNSGVEGTGIGLVISKRLALAMGGDITFDSDPGVRTCFHLSLPLHTGQQSASSLTEISKQV
jgi:signal transduction histidine kinase